MKRPAEKSDEFLKVIVDWQATEDDLINYASTRLPKAGSPLIKTMLRVMEFDARKRCAIQQMIVESTRKGAVNLDPDDLQALFSHMNHHIEEEEKVLAAAQAALDKTELFMPRSLLSYLIAGLKNENCLLRQFENEVKNAAIATSTGAKLFDSGKVCGPS